MEREGAGERGSSSIVRRPRFSALFTMPGIVITRAMYFERCAVRKGLLIAITVICQTALFGNGASKASYYDGPWCAVFTIGSGDVAERCDYRDFETCRMDIIAGNRGFCRQNGYFLAEQAKRSAKSGAHKRNRH